MIIGFGHKARQGKDTAGEAVVDFYNRRRVQAYKHGMDTKPARLFKFADELYRVCREEFGMVGKDAPLLQRVGESRRNSEGLDYWIKLLGKQMAKFDGIKVITDMRYANEADFIKGLGGFVVNVSRIGEDGTPYVASDRDPNHPSETSLDGYNFDFFIKAKSGDSALVAQQAITLAEYISALKG